MCNSPRTGNVREEQHLLYMHAAQTNDNTVIAARDLLLLAASVKLCARAFRTLTVVTL